MTAIETRRAVQRLLNVKDDGDIGKFSRAAFDLLAAADDDSQWPPVAPSPVPAHDSEVHEGRATSFADPADVRAFRRCKDNGGTDNFCYSKGDNGEGTPVLGDHGKATDTTGSVPMCALPPDDWKKFGSAAAGKKVRVTARNGRSVVCELRDTMPWKKNVTNGAIIDLNPAAVAALGHEPPLDTVVAWQWV